MEGVPDQNTLADSQLKLAERGGRCRSLYVVHR